MAPKRKADDFIYTLSDNEEIPNEEEEIPEPQPPKKKAKKNKKSTQSDDAEVDGVWGKKDDNDGAMDSDFEFAEDGTAEFRAEDFEGWGFDGAKKGMNGNAAKRIVDVDEIVRRRRGAQEGTEAQANGEKEQSADGASDIDEDEDKDEDIELDDQDDEVLAADGFGMGAASDEESGEDEAEEESDQDQDEQDDGDGDASDDDSVATPVDHPDDAAESDETDDEEDPEEAAKRAAFFAPEEKKPAGKQNGKSSFQSMSLSRPILRGLNSVGFNQPTPIQAKTIPLALEGKDLVGGAVTGSGKTAAFVVPILERLLYRPNKIPTSRVVILTPTRELAIQCHSVATKLASHTDIKFCLAVGGLSLKVQEAELRLRPDVIIATPGRFIDHMRNSASFSTDTVEILVLDEADRMLEDGFADELNEILTTLPKSRQTMLFSATMTSSVDRLVRAGLNKPVRVMVDSQRKTVDKLEQKFVRLRPGREEKRMGYLIHICKTMHTERVIIFFRQKKEAHRARIIFALFNLSCAELHGSMNQAQRISSVEAFRDGKVSFLLATDLASRGLDIKGVDTVINYEGPQTLEIYVHRVGRTARAGRSGVAITLAAEPDRKVVKAAVKAGKAQGAKISSLIIDLAEADKWQDKIDEMSDEIEEIAQEEKEEKQLAQAEMQIKKGENMVLHEDEIKSRPKRTWFETQHDKKKAKDAGRAELNGLKESLKKKGNGKLSNKDKKKLDAKSARTEGMWKKGSAERAGKGAVLNFKGDKKNKAKKLSLLQYLFPRSLRERYRERFINFHLDTFPYYKHRIQSRIYRFILDRQRRRREQSRLVDHARRLLLGLPAPNKDTKDGVRAHAGKMNSMPGNGSMGTGNYGAEGGRERGARRRKLAAMAGSMYRAGATAVNEIKESYYQTKSQEIDTSESSRITIPGSFPDVAIVTKGNEQMVLFPSYAKRHIRRQPRQFENPGGPPHSSTTGVNEQDYWTSEWSRHEDEKATVDVDVRGWIYSPHRGPMTRRNRVLIGLARQLSGIPAPKAQQADPSPPAGPSLSAMHQQHEEERERERIAREAKEIERRGQAEEEAAQKGGYSEQPRDMDSEGEGNRRRHGEQQKNGSRSPPSPSPASPPFRGRTITTGGAELTDAELAVANANLMARIAPFMTTPLVEVPITLFFFNESHAQSRTVTTNDSGHFTIRAALDFVPTHVRVLASEDISYTEPVHIIEPKGVSLISDIDDTIKRSNIALGAKEIFRNTFIRELNDLTVDGVKDWYNALHDLGVRIHYCSNSPWQLYPVLATFFKLAGLPPGSLHLKHYTGMLQGIFEPVAERKKGTLEKIMRDFPERKFLLVGDSGEADLEVYTELAVANPGRIVAIFIRDVTTPEQTGYFDSGFDTRNSRIHRANPGSRPDQGSSTNNTKDGLSSRPPLPPRVATMPKASDPAAGDLIDLAEEPEQLRRVKSERAEKPKAENRSQPSTRATDLLGRKPPPKPAKPSSLQSAPAVPVLTTADIGDPDEINKKPPAPPQPRKTSQPSSHSTLNKTSTPHPLKQMQNTSDQIARDEQIPLGNSWSNGQIPRAASDSPASSRGIILLPPPPPPPPRRRGTPSSNTTTTTTTTASSPMAAKLSPRFAVGNRRQTGTNSDVDSFESLPPSVVASAYSSGNGGGSPAPNKKLDLWRRRLQRAQETLDQHGVALYTWRRGDEVVNEALGIVRGCLEETDK
ncbi:nucleolar DEAD-box protein required for synthesis of 60S ribosomal subunit [Parahypoxylon ruwenzoriense]